MKQQPEPFRKMFLFKGPPLVKLSAILWWEWHWRYTNPDLLNQWHHCNAENCVKSTWLNDKKIGVILQTLHSCRGSPRAKRHCPRFLMSHLMSHFVLRPPWWTRPPLSVRTCQAAAVLRITRWCVPRKWIHTFTPGSRPRPQRVSRPHASDTHKKKSSERKPWLTNQNAVLMPRVCVWAAFCYLSHNWQDML